VTIRVIAVTLVILGIATGCTQKLSELLNREPPVVVVETEPSDADLLLDYYAHISDLKGDELLSEYQRAQQTFIDEPTDRNCLQLVMLLSSQDTPFRNTNAANALLHSWLDDASNAESKLRPLAELFDDYLAEIDRLDEAISRQESMLGEAGERAARQAQQIDTEKKWSANLQKKYDVEKARAAALQKKLDALLEMEMKLIEREQITNPNTQ